MSARVPEVKWAKPRTLPNVKKLERNRKLKVDALYL